jgi:nucleoside-diphosphate-sugar epimerase
MVRLPQEDLEHVLRCTRPLWEEARGRSLFMTGGTGFFGCWLLESFLFINQSLALDARITVLTREPEAFLRKCPHLAGNPALKLVRGDVVDLSAAGERYDFVIHAATEASAKQASERPPEMLFTIVEGTRRTLEFARQCGVGKFLLTSSGAVYGDQPPEITHLSEDYRGAPDCLDPRSVYAEGKRTAELMSILYSRDAFEVKIARCFAFVGPHLPLDAHFAIGNFLRDALRGGPLIVAGDGTPRRSYLYAADLSVWLWTILFLGQPSRAYNVGSERAYSIAEIAHAVADALDPALKVIIKQEIKESSRLHQYVPSTLLARESLSLQEHFSLSDEIRRTAAWTRLNGQSIDGDDGVSKNG